MIESKHTLVEHWCHFSWYSQGN